MKRLILLLILFLSPLAHAATLYNGETVPFSGGGAWDANKSTLYQTAIDAFSKPNHLRASINVAKYWGAAAYIFNAWKPIDLSGAKTIQFAAKSSAPVTVLVELADKAGAASSRVAITLTTSYQVFSISMNAFTGFDASKAVALIFAVSVPGNPTYQIDIDNIEAGDGSESDIPPLQIDPDVQEKAGDLAMQLRNKPFFLAGAGGVDTKNLKLDIYYKYLVKGWRKWNQPDGEYANIITQIADSAGAVPMFTYYFLAYQFEIKNYDVLTTELLHEYLSDLRLLFQKMGTYNKPVLLHMEPDFFGYLQQYAMKLNRPAAEIAAKIHYADVPECASMPENVGGMFNCILTMGRTLAPKVKIGYHASMWGDWFDPRNPGQIPAKTKSIANFLLSLGADKTDFVTVETVDRDAGFLEATRGDTGAYCNQRCFDLHFSWVSHITSALKKPALWWQMPFGVPANSPGYDYHYRDNRVQYFFGHVPLAINIGGFGMVYGAGADKQTTPDTDNGQFRLATDNYRAGPLSLK